MLETVKLTTKKLLLEIKSKEAKKVFNKASTAPEWLDSKELETLQKQYPVKTTWQKYEQDTEALCTIPDTKGANRVLSLLNSTTKPLSFLELGCQHGMTSYALKLAGHNATGIDIDSEHFSQVAQSQGVELYKMDATALTFADESFDFVYSYNAFEHMDNPEKALKEALRVVKKTGYIYINFNPLYMSPWGLHSWQELAIPYLAMLFSPDTIKSAVASQHLWYCNGWSCQAYRDLWQKYSEQLSIVKYQETVNPFHLDMIVKYPSCFKSKTDYFDDLCVEGMEILFQKK